MRRLRAILTTAALWALLWILAELTFLAVAWLFAPVHPSGFLFEYILVVSLLAGITGTISGSAFAIALMIAESRRTVDALSKARMALWGAIGGAALPGLLAIATRIWPEFAIAGVSFRFSELGLTFVTIFASAALGAVLASTHLALARRFPGSASRRNIGAGAT